MANSYDQIAIYRFPHEIFHHIFTIAVLEELDSTRETKRPRPIASLTISQVSQRWRIMAQDLPFIWTNIYVFHFRDSQRNMVEELMSRSKGLPLHISLEYNRRLTSAETRNCWEIFLAIMSCSARWKSLRIAVNEDLFTQICGNFGGRAAPLLQRLELVVLGTPKRYGPLGYHPDAHGISPLYFEVSCTDRLKYLSLHGIRLRMPSPTYIQKLETLSLEYIAAMDILCRPPLPTDSPPLSTRLRALAVTGIGHLNLSPRSFISEYTAFLTSLALTNIHGHSLVDISRLFTHLASTTLRELSVSNVDSPFWQGLLDSMRAAPRYPAVHSLHLACIDDFTELPVHFILGFPSLEVLSLSDLNQMEHLLRCDAIFPKMHTLRVRGVPYKHLCDVVDCRIDANVALTSLEVDTPQFLDLSSLAYLQRNVPNFMRVPADTKLLDML